MTMMAFLTRKAKDNAEKRWNAKESHLKGGGQILLRQTKSSKLDTPCTSEPHKVVSKKGSEVTVKSNRGEIQSKCYSCKEVPLLAC